MSFILEHEPGLLVFHS